MAKKLNEIFKDIADAIRSILYKDVEPPKIKGLHFLNEILLIADFGFAKNMVDATGEGITQVTSIIVDDRITSINTKAFANTKITNVTLHDGVTSIGGSAFSGCGNLKSIDLKQVQRLGSNCFTQTGITDIYIPETVTDITGGSGTSTTAFVQMYKLKSIRVDENNNVFTSRDNNGEECNVCIRKTDNTLMAGCVNSIIPKGVTSIHGDAFSYSLCPKILVFPNTLASISGRAFAGCDAVTSVEVKSIINYKTYAFMSCLALNFIVPDLSTLLKSTFEGGEANPMSYGNSYLYVRNGEITELQENIVIPNEITSINQYAFYGCISLQTVKFHSNIKRIGISAFAYCKNINTYDFSELDTPPQLDTTGAFKGTHPDGWSIIVKKGTLDTWKSADNWSAFTNIVESE
jgi:hypothetical protein